MKRFALLALLAIAPVAGHAQAVAPLPQKDAGVATLVGVIIPGGGQLYAEETGRGLFIMAAAVTAITVGLSSDVKAVYVPPYYSDLGITIPGYSRAADHSGPIIGCALGAAFWIAGIVDAGPAARRTNAKRSRIAFVPQHGGVGVRVAF